MPIKMNEEKAGKQLTVHASGRLTKDDYGQFVPEFERLVKENGHLRVLFHMDDFHGWKASAAWEDLKFATKHFSDIDRIAMVGEKKWQQGMAAFCKPFTKAEVRYFDQTQRDDAQTWLDAA